MIKYFFVFLLLIFISPAQAEVLEPLPTPETIEQKDFEQQSKLIEETFEDNEYLNFEIRIPNRFTVKPADELKNIKKGLNTYGEIFHAYGRSTYDQRPFISVKSIELDRLMSAKDWFMAEVLKNNATLKGIEANGNNEYDAFFVRLDNAGRTQVIRSKGFRHENRLISVEYVLPSVSWEKQKDTQIHSIQSFRFLNMYPAISPERIIKYQYLDSFSMDYPVSWKLIRKSENEINRHDLSFQSTDANNFLLATIDISVISNKSLKDIMDATVYPRNLGDNVKAVKSKITNVGYEIQPVLEKRPYNLDYETILNVTEVYPLRRKKSDIFVHDKKNPIVNELWLTVIRSLDEIGKDYIISMIAPSRDLNFHQWAIASSAYELMVQTAR